MSFGEFGVSVTDGALRVLFSRERGKTDSWEQVIIGMDVIRGIVALSKFHAVKQLAPAIAEKIKVNKRWERI